MRKKKQPQQNEAQAEKKNNGCTKITKNTGNVTMINKINAYQLLYSKYLIARLNFQE